LAPAFAGELAKLRRAAEADATAAHGRLLAGWEAAILFLLASIFARLEQIVRRIQAGALPGVPASPTPVFAPSTPTQSIPEIPSRRRRPALARSTGAPRILLRPAHAAGTTPRQAIKAPSVAHPIAASRTAVSATIARPSHRPPSRAPPARSQVELPREAPFVACGGLP